jgi:hypothetical protein
MTNGNAGPLQLTQAGALTVSQEDVPAVNTLSLTSTANNLILPVANGQSTIALEFVGLTAGVATVGLYGSVDGTNFTAIGFQTSTLGFISTLNSDSPLTRVNVAGLKAIQIKVTVAGTGSATITSNATAATNPAVVLAGNTASGVPYINPSNAAGVTTVNNIPAGHLGAEDIAVADYNALLEAFTEQTAAGAGTPAMDAYGAAYNDQEGLKPTFQSWTTFTPITGINETFCGSTKQTRIRDISLQGYATSAGIAIYGTGCSITNNKLTYNGNEGYSVYNVAAITITSNEIAYNLQANFNYLNEGGAGKIAQCTSSTFTNNYVHDNLGPGPWWDTACTTAIVRKNLVLNNTIQGFAYEISSTGTFSYNVCALNGSGVTRSSNQAFPGQIYLNTSFNNTVSNNYVEVQAATGSGIMLAYDNTRGGSYTGGGNTFMNNTVIFHDATAYTGLQSYQGANPSYTETITNNIYSTTSATSDTHFEWWTGALSSLSGYQSTYSLETGSTITVATPPAITSLSNTVAPGTPLVRTNATPIAIYGNLTNDSIDVGAFAYVAHVWLLSGVNLLTVRSGCGNVTVYDWVDGTGTNTLRLVGYGFANATAAIAAMSTSGSNVTLALPGGNTVLFLDTSLSAFSISNVVVS